MSCCRTVVCLLWLCLCAVTQAGAQEDTSRPGFLSRLRKIGRDETANSLEKYRAGRIAIRQEQVLQEIRLTTQHARLFLNKGIDTLSYRQFMARTNAHVSLVEDGVFVNRGSGQTQRNLAVTATVLSELLDKTSERKVSLAAHLSSLESFVDRIDSLSTDSALYTFPFDSAATVKYIQRLTVMAKELGPVDTALRRDIGYLQQLQTDLDLLTFTISSHLDQVEKFHGELEAQTFQQEFPYLWQPARFHRTQADILRFSFRKEMLALEFYAAGHLGRLLILLLMLPLAWYFLRSLQQKLAEAKAKGESPPGNLVLRYTLLSSIIVVFSIFQFILLKPPYIIGFFLWFVSAISLAILFRGYISGFWWRFWVVSVGLFTLAGLNNMVLQASRLERWGMLVIALAGLGYGIYILRHFHRTELREKKIIYFITFMVLLEAMSAICNVLGRYNLAKTTMVVGFTGLVIAILFLWTVRLINETLSLVSGIYKHPDRKLFYIDFDRIGDKVPRFFYVFLVAGWFILVSRNFYGFRKLAIPFLDFLNTERTLGDYTFTINSLFIFLLIIAVATVISQIISFFAGEPTAQPGKDKQGRKAGVGSWLLLIRIFVLSLGIFLAFAAAGIPIDKLAIAIGALGVGIGLGLQGLVSNLVSGLIIAFEKPVNVGDTIEVDGKAGTMKSIGFRSSVINLSDGAALIIPNGDLLSRHLINWTMNKNKRRLNLVVGVAYGSNLKRVQELLEGIIQQHDKVLQYPEPVVATKAFQESSVDFDLFCWINNRDTLAVKSELITAIDEAFRKEGIVIPFPQQEVRIISNGETK